MTIREEENGLFDRWKKERCYDSFVRDGVFDEAVWMTQSPKITFILKEADWPGGNGNLRRNLIWEPLPQNWKTWNNVARWTKALLEGGEYPAYISEEERRSWLAEVSFLNLKKEGGGPRAKPRKIREAARKDAEFIQRQLSLYRPDLIICCGKWLVADILEKEVLRRTGLPVLGREEADGVPCFYTCFPGGNRLTPVVDFYHPEWFKGGHKQWRVFFEQMKSVRALLLPPEL